MGIRRLTNHVDSIYECLNEFPQVWPYYIVEDLQLTREDLFVVNVVELNQWRLYIQTTINQLRQTLTEREEKKSSCESKVDDKNTNEELKANDKSPSDDKKMFQDQFERMNQGILSSLDNIFGNKLSHYKDESFKTTTTTDEIPEEDIESFESFENTSADGISSPITIKTTIATTRPYIAKSPSVLKDASFNISCVKLPLKKNECLKSVPWKRILEQHSEHISDASDDVETEPDKPWNKSAKDKFMNWNHNVSTPVVNCSLCYRAVLKENLPSHLAQCTRSFSDTYYVGTNTTANSTTFGDYPTIYPRSPPKITNSSLEISVKARNITENNNRSMMYEIDTVRRLSRNCKTRWKSRRRHDEFKALHLGLRDISTDEQKRAIDNVQWTPLSDMMSTSGYNGQSQSVLPNATGDHHQPVLRSSKSFSNFQGFQQQIKGLFKGKNADNSSNGHEDADPSLSRLMKGPVHVESEVWSEKQIQGYLIAIGLMKWVQESELYIKFLRDQH